MRPLLNSAGINIRRAVGPALTGLVIAWWGMSSPFWIDSAASLGMIAALFWLVRTSYQPTSPVDDHEESSQSVNRNASPRSTILARKNSASTTAVDMLS